MEETKIIQQLLLLIQFVPFIGPAQYAIEAIVAYMCGNQEKARDKGITSTVNGLIDLAALALFLLSAAHIAVQCDRSATLQALKPILTTSCVITIASILIGAKIIAEQMARAVVQKVLSVHTASTSMVNTVNITATGIEAVVGTINEATNVTTNRVKSGYKKATNTVITVINTPKTTSDYIAKIITQIVRFIKARAQLIIAKITEIIKISLQLLLTIIIHIGKLVVNTILDLLHRFLPDLTKYPPVAAIDRNIMRPAFNAMIMIATKIRPVNLN